MKARVAVLASGVGTNLQALLEDPVVGPWIVLVVSDREDAPALARARRRRIEAVLLDPGAHPDPDAYGRALLEVLGEREIRYLALAGFMRVLPGNVVREFAGRAINVHPALLPAFPGAHPVEDALDHGVKTTGVTVHLVDEQVDHGPIVAQAPVQVRDGDDRDALEARIHDAEHRLFPAAVRALVEGRIHVQGRRVTVDEAAPPTPSDRSRDGAAVEPGR